MEFSNSYIVTLKEVFTNINTPYNRVMDGPVLLDNNDIMSHYIELNMVTNNIEVPTFLRRKFEYFIGRHIISDTNILVSPLTQNDYTNTATISIILKYGFMYKSYNSDIVKFITRNNEVYYVGKGLILNSEFKPLLYCTLSCSMDGNKYRYTNPKIYLDPTVFINSDTVSKHIIKKLIPCYISMNSLGVMRCPIYSYFHGDSFLNKPEIIIKDLSNIIKNTNSPNSINITEDIHNLLNNHIEELNENL